MRPDLGNVVALAFSIVLTSAGARAFERFDYNQQPARGFCPPLDAVFSAEVVLDPPDRYFAVLSVLEVLPEEVGGDDCIAVLAHIPEGMCVRVRDLAPRMLDPKDAERLRLVIDDVRNRLLNGPDPSCGAVDPCLIRRYWFDGVRASSELCADTRVPPDGEVRLLEAIEALRPRGVSAANGDANGDGRRDVSDAVYILLHLFLGGPPPVEASCPEGLECLPPRIAVIQNGDANGDHNRDVSDAVALLSWLFLRGAAPAPICSCTEASCEGVECAGGGTCIPLSPELGGTVCAADLTSCEEVESIYEFLVSADGERCLPEVGCHVLEGHCGIGLGGCYHAVSRNVRQEHLDALAERFLEVGWTRGVHPRCVRLRTAARCGRMFRRRLPACGVSGSLPARWNRVPADCLVRCQDRHAMDQRLADEHAIEWIAVDRGEVHEMERGWLVEHKAIDSMCVAERGDNFRWRTR